MESSWIGDVRINQKDCLGRSVPGSVRKLCSGASFNSKVHCQINCVMSSGGPRMFEAAGEEHVKRAPPVCGGALMYREGAVRAP